MYTQAKIENFEDPIWGISCHPQQPKIFATACSDGNVRIYDLRTGNVNIDYIKPKESLAMDGILNIALNLK